MPNFLAPRLVMAILLLSLGLVLAGCGQKGDLYLPEDRQQERR